MLAGYLRGSEFVVAGNSRSDDEPNVESYLGRPVNHQWTKSYEFEAALAAYRDRWLPGAPVYSSPLRPLYELQIIASLSDDIDGYLRTASCNRVKGEGWCRSCAKCAWVFLATAALFGHDLAIRKTGGDMFADPALAGVYAEMAGLTGSKPFECTGSEDEVRTAIRAVGPGPPAGRLARPGHLPARPGRHRRAPAGRAAGRLGPRRPRACRPAAPGARRHGQAAAGRMARAAAWAVWWSAGGAVSFAM